MVMRSVGWRRMSWLRNIREWFNCSSCDLFRAAKNKIHIPLMIANLSNGDFVCTRSNGVFQVPFFFTENRSLSKNGERYQFSNFISTVEFSLVLIFINRSTWNLEKNIITIYFLSDSNCNRLWHCLFQFSCMLMSTLVLYIMCNLI